MPCRYVCQPCSGATDHALPHTPITQLMLGSHLAKPTPLQQMGEGIRPNSRHPRPRAQRRWVQLASRSHPRSGVECNGRLRLGWLHPAAGAGAWAVWTSATTIWATKAQPELQQGDGAPPEPQAHPGPTQEQPGHQGSNLHLPAQTLHQPSCTQPLGKHHPRSTTAPGLSPPGKPQTLQPLTPNQPQYQRKAKTTIVELY